MKNRIEPFGPHPVVGKKIGFRVANQAARRKRLLLVDRFEVVRRLALKL
jgi:hypothetical protein